MKSLRNRSNFSELELAAIPGGITKHRTLGDVLDWGFKQPAGTVRPGIVSEVVVLDEFTHDVIVPWRHFVFVYGTT